MSPDRIDRYQVKSELGRGGMATVYLAYDPRFEREVAIKVLPREFLHDPNFIMRFDQEAKVIASLEHRGILPVYDFGESDGAPYIVMRYMPHKSLRERMNAAPGGTLPLPDVVPLIKQVADALDFAHERGIIHRDLKPDNILVDDAGNAVLSDFGIAKVIEATQTISGTITMGTPIYMAPEQVRGQKLTSAVDLYALGAMIFELLTGKPPFLAEDPYALGYLHVNEPIPLINNVRPDLPGTVQDFLERAMAKNPADRFGSAGELAQALEAAAAGKPFLPASIPMPEVYSTRGLEPGEDLSPPTMPDVYLTRNAPQEYVPEIPLHDTTPRKTEHAIPAKPRQKTRLKPHWTWGILGGVMVFGLILLAFILLVNAPDMLSGLIEMPVPRDSVTATAITTQTTAGSSGSTILTQAASTVSAQVEDGSECYLAEWQGDLTIPDDSIFTPYTTYYKTWRIKNAGSCPWSTDFMFVKAYSDGMLCSESVPMADTSIMPGETVDVTVNCTTPMVPGTYEAGYNILSGDGLEVPPGTFFTRIIVVNYGYYVEEGDTCGSIAASYGVAVGDLIWTNSLMPDCSDLTVGQILVIPTSSGTATLEATWTPLPIPTGSD